MVRHIKCVDTKRKRTKSENSSRNTTKNYFLSIGQNLASVCKVFFFNTLAISEIAARTALSKVTPLGTLEDEKRGGRQSATAADRDKRILEAVSEHIDRYRKIESHFFPDPIHHDSTYIQI